MVPTPGWPYPARRVFPEPPYRRLVFPHVEGAHAGGQDGSTGQLRRRLGFQYIFEVGNRPLVLPALRIDVADVVCALRGVAGAGPALVESMEVFEGSGNGALLEEGTPTLEQILILIGGIGIAGDQLCIQCFGFALLRPFVVQRGQDPGGFFPACRRGIAAPELLEATGGLLDPSQFCFHGGQAEEAPLGYLSTSLQRLFQRFDGSAQIPVQVGGKPHVVMDDLTLLCLCTELQSLLVGAEGLLIAPQIEQQIRCEPGQGLEIATAGKTTLQLRTKIQGLLTASTLG